MGLMLDEIVKNVNKSAKEEIITKGLSEFDYQRIPFTSPRMNYMTYGGLPIGKITEFFGEEHGGKTTSALDIVANYQQMDNAKDILYIDAENTLDVEWAKKIGVDVDNLYILQPKSQSAEDIFQIICDSVDTGEVGLWVLDSIGALMSSQELDKTLEDKTYGGVSKPLTLFGKKIEMLMKRYSCTGIGINQLRDNMNSTWGGTTTPGGRGWKHFCAVRIQFSRGKFFDEKGNDMSRGAENPAGNYVMANAEKNKTAPPTRHVGQYRLRYNEGIDYFTDLIDVGIYFEAIQKHGAWFDIINPDTGEVLEGKIQGQNSVREFLIDEKNSKILEELENYIDKKIREY